jgi:hypothetical protein
MGTPAPPTGVTALWDEVIISVYSLGTGIGVGATTPNYPTGWVVATGQNVDRVSYGQIVTFRQGAYITQGNDTSWAVVPQEAILITYQEPAAP